MSCLGYGLIASRMDDFNHLSIEASCTITVVDLVPMHGSVFALRVN